MSVDVPSMIMVVSFFVIGCLTTKDTGALTECSLPSKVKNPWYTPVWKSSGTNNVTSTVALFFEGTLITFESGHSIGHLVFW